MNELLHKASHEGMNHTIRYTLKLSKSSLNIRSERENIFNTVYGLLNEYFQINWFSISFPELVYGMIRSLKLYIANCKNLNWSNRVKGLINKIEKQSEFVYYIIIYIFIILIDYK